tara:strand:+ start:183 stop:401 length:219 start_codon:yes stop_codon:yes gene_type:complete
VFSREEDEVADVWKASLKPRPGREGTTSVNGWVDVGEVGEVRGAKRGVKERFVSGKVGIRRRGRACLCGDLR